MVADVADSRFAIDTGLEELTLGRNQPLLVDIADQNAAVPTDRAGDSEPHTAGPSGHDRHVRHHE
jgi:hypothetical protein